MNWLRKFSLLSTGCEVGVGGDGVSLSVGSVCATQAAAGRRSMATWLATRLELAAGARRPIGGWWGNGRHSRPLVSFR